MHPSQRKEEAILEESWTPYTPFELLDRRIVGLCAPSLRHITYDTSFPAQRQSTHATPDGGHPVI